MTWKVLIYDANGRDVIAPLLKVKDLRDLGVTLHLPIDKPRQPVPGVPAIYFCEPTEENIQLIAADVVSELYEAYFVNFCSPISRQLLEYFAEKVASLPAIHHVRVIDRTLSYVAESGDLFSLMQRNSFFTPNSSTSTESSMRPYFDRAVAGLSHVVQSLQTVPVIAYARSSSLSEMLADQLARNVNDLMKEQLLQHNPSATGRPVLLIVDRSMDPCVALHHPFTYHGLLTDLLGMRLNKVEVPVAAGDGANAGSGGGSGNSNGGAGQAHGAMKTYELEPETDAFYQKYAGCDFGEIGDHVDAALVAYKKEYAEVAARGGNDEGNGGGAGDEPDTASMSRMLANAPKLAERKRSIDAHTSLAFAILERVQRYGLDRFHGVEHGLLHEDTFDDKMFVELLQSPALPLVDRQRLFLFAYLHSLTTENDAQLRAVEQHAHLVGNPRANTADGAGGGGASAGASSATSAATAAPFPAFEYVRKALRGWRIPSQGDSSSGSSAGASSWRLAQSVARGIARTLKSTASLVPLTRLVDSLLCDATAARDQDRVRLRESLAGKDPRSMSTVDLSNVAFSQCIVFVVGGGSTVEYDDLKCWEARNPRKTVVYGCSEMLTGESFLAQLNNLGQEMLAGGGR